MNRAGVCVCRYVCFSNKMAFYSEHSLKFFNLKSNWGQQITWPTTNPVLKKYPENLGLTVFFLRTS